MRRPPIPGLVMADGWLQPYARQIRDRQRLFDLKMKRIIQRSGTLKGMRRATAITDSTGTRGRGHGPTEWAPAARGLFLTGDFNGWDRRSHPLVRNERGVWKSPFLRIPRPRPEGESPRGGADGTGRTGFPPGSPGRSRTLPPMIFPGNMDAGTSLRVEELRVRPFPSGRAVHL